METMIVELADKGKAKAVKAVVKALGGSVRAPKNSQTKKASGNEEESPYNPEFVAKIKQGEKDISEGRYTIIKLEDLWK